MRRDGQRVWARCARWCGLWVVCVSICSGRMAYGDGDPLSATLVVHGAGRSGAPRSATVTLLWNGTSLLEGDLQIAIMDGRSVLSRSEVTDLALAPGAQTFGLLLPAVGAYGDSQSTRAQLTFRTTDHTIDLQEHPYSVPNLNERLLSVIYPVPVVGEEEVRHIAADLRPDWLNPESKPGRLGALHCGLCPLRPDAFPATPEEYCTADLVVLTGAGVGKLRMVQLEALRAWVRAGGSLCVVNPGGLPETHQAFLAQLFEEGDGEAALAFGLDGEPQGLHLATRHLALGRVALVLGDASEGAEQRKDPAWRRTLAFLWKLRADQVNHVVQTGTWNENAEAKEMAASRSVDHELRNHMREYRSQLALQPIDLLVSSDYLSLLMPRDMRFVRIGQLTFILALLVICVGPVDYFLLKRLRLQRYTWLTVPLYVGLATVTIVLLANHAMGRHDRRGKMCVLDTDRAGIPVRQNDIRLLVPSSHGEVGEHIQRALVAPTSVRGNNSGMPSGGGGAEQQVRGRYPHDFEVTFSVAQWRPTAWRTMTLRPTAAFPWTLTPLEDGDIWSARGARAYWRRFGAVNTAKPQGAYVLTQGKLHTLKNDTWVPPVGLGSQHPLRLTVLAEAPRIGYFSIVSAVSPSCETSGEDLFVYDITDPDHALLILVWREGDTLFTSRTSFYRERGADRLASSDENRSSAQRERSTSEGG